MQTDREKMTRLEANFFEAVRLKKELKVELERVKVVNAKEIEELKATIDHQVNEIKELKVMNEELLKLAKENASKKNCPFPNCEVLCGSESTMSRHFDSYHSREIPPKGWRKMWKDVENLTTPSS